MELFQRFPPATPKRQTPRSKFSSSFPGRFPTAVIDGVGFPVKGGFSMGSGSSTGAGGFYLGRFSRASS